MHAFSELITPVKGYSDWVICTVEKDISGHYGYLATDGPSFPYLCNVTEPYNLHYENELTAHFAAEAYYIYHKAPYPYHKRFKELLGVREDEQEDCSGLDSKSTTMVFI